MHQFLKFILEWNSTCFGQFLCPPSVHTEMVYFIQVCWHVPFLCVQWKTPDDGQRNCPKHVEFYSKIWEIGASSWFYYKKFITMRGHMNVKIRGWSEKFSASTIDAVSSWSCSQAISKTVWHIPLLCVQWKTPDDGQRNCPKHVEFHSKINLRNLCIYLVYYKEKDTRTMLGEGYSSLKPKLKFKKRNS